MQPHEGPRPDRDREERARQGRLTWRLLLAIAALLALLAGLLLYRTL